MSRTQRFQMQVRGPKKNRKFTEAEVVGKVQREIKRRLVAEGHIVDPAKRVKPEWHWALKISAPGNLRGGVVNADNRSEAKAAIKKQLGVNGRLPGYVVILGPANANPS